MQSITLSLWLLCFLALLSPAAPPLRDLPPIQCVEFRACLTELERQAGPARVAAATVYLADIGDYAPMNRAYEDYFRPDRNNGIKPARNTVQMKLPAPLRMELQAVLYEGPAPLEGVTPPGVKNVAPISPAVRTPERIFIAGILGRDSNTGIVPASPDEQIAVCFSRLANVLATAGIGPQQLLGAKLFRTPRIPEASARAALARFFGDRAALVSVIEVEALALGAQIGIHGVALRRDYSKDVSSLDAAVKTLYEVISGPAGQERDWDRLRYLLHPTARFQTVRPPGGIATLSVDDYISRSGKMLVEQGFFEEETSRKVESFEGIAHVWSGFRIRRSPDTPILRTGINSIQLYWDRTRWWVMSVYWDNAR